MIVTANHDTRRHIQRDARLWAELTGTNYTTALRQVGSPLAQGILGDRLTVEQLRAALEGVPSLGEFGFDVAPRLSDPDGLRGNTSMFLGVVLSAEVLRMFTPTSDLSAGSAVSSYSLKHTAEWLLGAHQPYVSNGELIWAAATLGLPMSEPDGPNVLIGIADPEHTYVRKALGHGDSLPGAHHHKPAGWDHLRAALEEHSATGAIPRRMVPEPPAPREGLEFHNWLVEQARRPDPVGDLAADYEYGVRQSEDEIVTSPAELRELIEAYGASESVLAAVDAAAEEWVRRR